jgi:hypothetical protein
VVIVPLKGLAPGDHFMLMVTLMDGTELSFTVTNGETSRDGQVDIYADSDSPEAIRVLLKENQKLQDENRRYQEQGTSVDHAGRQRRSPCAHSRTQSLRGERAVSSWSPICLDSIRKKTATNWYSSFSGTEGVSRVAPGSS